MNRLRLTAQLDDCCGIKIMNVFDQWHPVTSDYGLLKCSFDKLCHEFEKWSREIHLRRKKKFLTTSLEDSFQSLEKLTPLYSKTLFVQTQSEWIAVFQNGIRGSDPVSIIGALSRSLNTTGMRVCATPDEQMFPATIWEVYDTEANGGALPLGYRRTLYVSNDGGRWVFGQSGDPFDFEDISRYSEKMKKKRFDRNLLEEYLSNFGISPFEDEFFKVSKEFPSALYEKFSYLGKILDFRRSYTLQQVKDGLPWKK